MVKNSTATGVWVGPGSRLGTTMNVATLPELFTYQKERAVMREKKTATCISATRKDFLQAEHENAACSQHRSDLQAGHACMQDSKGHSIRSRNMLPNSNGHLQKGR